ncbi:peroxisomal membrane protein PMP34-like [Liolophura sinensis]|uniref:peroxisomal membrane protein PMP34-like n=1 Tax=Liolophura sinensis TaxID=3198878 RepID=UPI003158BECA
MAQTMSQLYTMPSLVCELSSSVSTGKKTAWMSALKGLLTYDNLVHAVAGATGSVIAMSVFFPLDTARTRLQVDDQRKAKHSPQILKEIAKEEGISAWYRGLFPVVSSLCCSNFVYFYSYNGLKAVCLAEGSKGEPAKELLLAFVAGVVNVLVTTPLWVVNTRLKLQGAHFRTAQYKQSKHPYYQGILDAFRRIIRDEGTATLWNGTMSSIVLASNPAVQFMVYEAVKRYFQRLFRQTELSGLVYFMIGAIAKTVATIVTYPLQVIQSRRRAGYESNKTGENFVQALSDMIRTKGIASLYKGMEAKLLQTVLTAALMFVCYEKISAVVFRVLGIIHQTQRDNNTVS